MAWYRAVIDRVRVGLFAREARGSYEREALCGACIETRVDATRHARLLVCLLGFDVRVR